MTASGFDVKLDVRLYYSDLVIVSSADTLLYLMYCVLTKRLRQAHKDVYKRVLRPCFTPPPPPKKKKKKKKEKNITLTSPLNIFNIANNQILVTQVLFLYRLFPGTEAGF